MNLQKSCAMARNCNKEGDESKGTKQSGIKTGRRERAYRGERRRSCKRGVRAVRAALRLTSAVQWASCDVLAQSRACGNPHAHATPKKSVPMTRISEDQ
eukprot:1672436-Pleurochrysis_carterae.AAC.1